MVGGAAGAYARRAVQGRPVRVEAHQRDARLEVLGRQGAAPVDEQQAGAPGKEGVGRVLLLLLLMMMMMVMRGGRVVMRRFG